MNEKKINKNKKYKLVFVHKENPLPLPSFRNGGRGALSLRFLPALTTAHPQNRFIFQVF
jgi:hypothetical protein